MWMPVMVSCKLGKIFHRSRDTATKTPVCLPTTVSSVSPAWTDPHGKCRINFFPENKWWWWCNENCSPWAIYLMVKIARSYIVFFSISPCSAKPPPQINDFTHLRVIWIYARSLHCWNLETSGCLRAVDSIGRKSMGLSSFYTARSEKEAISGILVRHTVVHHPRSSEFAPSDSPYHANSY